MIELKAREWTERTGTGTIAIVDLQAQTEPLGSFNQLRNQTVLIDGDQYWVNHVERTMGSAVVGLVVRPVADVPEYVKKLGREIPYQVQRQPLIDLVDDCLDLLDQLVDPLLETTVMKSRVQTWKKMMRDLVEDYRKDGSGE